MFIWRVDLIRNLIAELLPELDRGLHNIENGLDSGDTRGLRLG